MSTRQVHLDARRSAVRGGRLAATCVALLVSTGAVRTVHAEPKALSVQLDNNVTACPDAETIRQRLLAALPRTPREDSSANSDIRVDFARQARGYRVTITLTGLSAGTRVIEHPKTSCDAMIDAAGVTLALMLDPLEPAKKNDAESPAAPPVTPPEKKTPPNDAPPGPISSIALDVGGGATRGILGNVAPAFGLTGRWTRSAPWSFGVGIFHQPIQSASALAQSPDNSSAAQSGTVSVVLTGLSTEVCLTFLGNHASMALDACASMRLALAIGGATGYPRDGHKSRALMTAGPGLIWSQYLGAGRIVADGPEIGWAIWARGSVDVPVVRASFAVDGVGLVYNGESPFVALSLGVSLSFP